MADWRAHWESRTSSGHRWTTDAQFAAAAREVLFHLDGGATLLDFGCGAGEYLAGYARAFQSVVAVDRSPSMLAAARERLERTGAGHVRFIEADDASVFEKARGPFDRVLAAQVIQYLEPEAVERFVAGARARLAPGGRIVLFDTIDPAAFELWLLGAYSWREVTPSRLTKAAARLALGRTRAGREATGRGFTPAFFEGVAARHGLDVVCPRSLYYEYRFHAVFTGRA